MADMYYVMRVTKKGQVTLPVALRRKYRIEDKVIIFDEGNRIVVVPIYGLEKLFGIDGEIGIEIAKELLRDKKREIELEKEIRA